MKIERQPYLTSVLQTRYAKDAILMDNGAPEQGRPSSKPDVRRFGYIPPRPKWRAGHIEITPQQAEDVVAALVPPEKQARIRQDTERAIEQATQALGGEKATQDPTRKRLVFIHGQIKEVGNTEPIERPYTVTAFNAPNVTEAGINPGDYPVGPLRSIASTIRSLGTAEAGNMDDLRAASRGVAELEGTVDEALRQRLLDAITQLMIFEQGELNAQREEQHSRENARRRAEEEEAEAFMGGVDNLWTAYRSDRNVWGERNLTNFAKSILRGEAVSALDADRIELLNGLTLEDKNKLVDKIFNQMMSDKVDNAPNQVFEKAFGQAGTKELEEFKRELEGAKADPRHRTQAEFWLRQYIENEFEARTMMHNANYAVATGSDVEGVAKYIDQFRTGWVDMAFSKKGVTDAARFYEQALLKVRAENGGYIPNTEVLGSVKENKQGRVHELARKYLNDAIDAGVLPSMEEWEKDRALAFGRAMSTLLGKAIEIAMTSYLPEKNPFVDQYAQRIIAELAPFRHNFKFYLEGNQAIYVFAHRLNRETFKMLGITFGKPWSKKQLEEFEHMSMNDKVRILNGLMEEDKERFLSVLNPFKIGGFLSLTTWRLSSDDNATAAIGPLLGAEPDDAYYRRYEAAWGRGLTPEDREYLHPRNWIGTGVIIEKSRGDLNATKKNGKPDEEKRREARENIKGALEKAATITPLRIFYNVLDVQKAVLEGLRDVYPEGKFEYEYFNKKGEIVKEPEKPDPNLTKLMKGSVLDDMLRGDLDKLVILQADAVRNRRRALKFDLIKDEGQRKRVERIATLIKEKFTEGPAGKTQLDTFIHNLKDRSWTIPFNFGTDDVPYDEYNFEVTGPRAVARRWGDMTGAAAAGKGVNEFLDVIEHVSTVEGDPSKAVREAQEKLIEAMGKIFAGIKSYNADFARDFTAMLAEGVIKFYAKDWGARLPFGMGTVISLSRKTSMAEVVYEKDAMAWDERQVFRFIRRLKNLGMITKEQRKTLGRKTPGSKLHISWAYLRTLGPILAIALAFYILTRAQKDQ